MKFLVINEVGRTEWTEVSPGATSGGAGPQGATGGAGPQGASGGVGPQGSVGPQGLVGAQGAMGAPGPAGQGGAQGPQGSQGVPGAQGSTGAQGAVGAPGVAGAAGAQGSTGAQGAVGPVASTSVIADPGAGNVIAHNDANIEVVLSTSAADTTSRSLAPPTRLGQTISILAAQSWVLGSRIDLDVQQTISLDGKTKVSFTAACQSVVLYATSVGFAGHTGMAWRMLALDGAVLSV